MRIGLLSDTHVPEAAEVLPHQLAEAFRGVDLILHAGDIYIPSVLDSLESIAPVLAARGDDDYGLTLIDRRVKEKHVLELEGHTLWLIHERPDPRRLPFSLSFWWESRLSSEQGTSPDIIVFGHEHRTAVDRVDGMLFVSPGSPTFLHYRRGAGTVGILDLSPGQANVDILQL